MKKFLKTSVILPIIIGLVTGAALFVMGEIQDAPGLCLLGIVDAFLLTVKGLHTTGIIPKGVLLPSVLICFGAGGIVLSVVLLLDGEFGDSPEFAFIGAGIGILLIIAGAAGLIKRKKK